MKKPVFLRIFQGEKLLGVKQFLDAQIVIGQPGDVQVALEGPSISLIHASIEEREDGCYHISDLGSASGTYVNGNQVLDAKLESGDVLGIGDYTVDFYIGTPKPKTGYTDTTYVGPGPGAKPVTAPPPIATAPAVVPPAVVPPPITAPAIVTPPPFTPPTTAAPPPIASKPPTVAPIIAPIIAPITPPVQQQPKSAPPAPPPIKPVTPPAPAVEIPPKPKLTPPAPKEAEKAKPIVLPPPPVSPIAPAASVGLGMSTAEVTTSSGSFNANLVGPRTRHAAGRKVESHKKSRKTFAPPSRYSDIKEFVKPSKGTVVEVLVAWRERVIANHHFSQVKTITIGSHPDNDIIVPVLSARVRKLPILRIDKQAVILVSAESRGELLKGQTSSSFAELMAQNRLVNLGKAGYGLGLDQGEMVTLDLGDQISVIIRYVSDSPKPLVAPLFDLTASETTGIVLAIAMVATLWLYMYIYQPPKSLADANDLEPLRTAQIILTPPTPAPLPPPATPAPTPVATPPPPVATPQRVKVQVSNKTQQAVKKSAPSTNLTTKVDPGKSASAAPNKNKTGPRQLTSPKQGGAIKTAPKEGAQMQSKSRDVSKAGVFSVFGNNGAQDQLAQSTTGSGELAGMANAATGKAGSAVDRAGKGLGSALKDTGVGGTGKSLEGIAGGVGTQGRGSGNAGYGTGGLGNKAGTKITAGGAGEDIPGTIDREAIRRVIRANLPSIRSCYERQLNRKPDLFGKIVLMWEIGEQGRVVSASVKSNELGGPEGKAVGDCLVERLKTWRFPAPPVNQQPEISYPFLFSN